MFDKYLVGTIQINDILKFNIFFQCTFSIMFFIFNYVIYNIFIIFVLGKSEHA